MKGDSGRGQCSGCRDEYSLKADGTVRAHKALDKPCPGSNQPPEAEEKKHVTIRKVVSKGDEERYPNVDKFPSLKRALIIKRVLDSGGSRIEAEKAALSKVGPRVPGYVARVGKKGRVAKEGE